jgi:UDP-N-acetylmuramoylalanine--D-glutamate ligase
MPRLDNQRIALLGAGRSGLAAAHLARSHGADVTVFDTGNPTELRAKLATLDAEAIPHITGQAATDLQVSPGQFDLCVTSPGIDASWPLPQKFISAGVPFTGETEFAFTFCETPLIAITGTNGKSTCTELIANILNGSCLRSVPCGNHGIPLSEVLTSGETYDVLALEISSFQLETIDTFRPRVGIWLNFADDHLDRYPDRESYFASKARLFENMTQDDLAVVLAGASFPTRAARPVTFSAFGIPADFTYSNGTFFAHGTAFGSSSDLKLLGRHNMENVLAALIACSEFGITPAAGLEALKSYGVPPHRCELVRDLDSRRYINDSKATNVHAVCACIRALDETVVLIAGGLDKNLDYTPLRDLVPGRVRAMVTIGTIAESLKTQFEDLIPCQTAPDMPTAVAQARALSQPGDAIVLSPTTSSFDMFSGYAERGNVFRTAVLALA